MTLRDILAAKGSSVYSIGPNATLDDVVQSLVEHKCGSLMVCDDENCLQILGIITERDILRVCATRLPLTEQKVSDAMTRHMVVGSPDDSIEDTMGLMTDRRVRHLPIVENGKLCGMVSIGDIVKTQHDSLSLENHYLKTYLHNDFDGQSSTMMTAGKPR